MGSEVDPSGPTFYATLTGELSQGDIVHGLPPAVLSHPLTICRPGGKPKQGWFNTIVDADPPAFGKGPETLHARAAREPGLGIVIWDDCQIDKMQNQGRDPATWYVAVAPIMPLTTLQPEHRAAVSDGRRLAFFPLPASADVGLPDSYVDLRLMWPIQQSALAERVTTLSSAARATLYAHLFRFLTSRQLPNEIVCPACNAVIQPHSLLEHAAE